MTLETTLQKAWATTKDKWTSGRYFQNYPNDIIAANLSRTPYYAMFDNAVVGVPDANVMHSVANTLIACVAGWSITYALGNSLLATGFGETYKKHAKKIDATYSALMTFGFGMAMNLGAGYSLKQATIASASRAVMAIPFGPLTRYYTDAFREIRGEKAIVMETNFKNKPWSYKAPRLAALVLIPTLAMAATMQLTNNTNTTKNDTSSHLKTTYHQP